MCASCLISSPIMTYKSTIATNSKSTHSYGASFDIAFVDRFDDQANCGTPTREMERLLNRYQKAGIIYVIPEGGCMHVTLRKP